MKRDEIIKILEENQDNIEAGNWEEVYDNITENSRDLGEFSDFLIENGIDPSNMFKYKIPNYAFGNSKLLNSINIPETVTKIGECTFANCKFLESIIIPNSVTEIGIAAFSKCSSLQSIIIPSSVTEIRFQAFSKCSSLTFLTISDGVTKIGWAAFDCCTSLKSITLPSSITEIDYYAFHYCTSLEEIKYDGTEEQWNKVKLNQGWIGHCPVNKKKNKITFLR